MLVTLFERGAGIFPFSRLRKKSALPFHSFPASGFDFNEINDLVGGWQGDNRHRLMTAYSSDYFFWRYGSVPVADYRVAVLREEKSGAAVVYRIKRTRGLHELRICDAFPAGPKGYELFSQVIAGLVGEVRPDVVTLINDHEGTCRKVLPFNYFFAGRYGPGITLRRLNDDGLFEQAAVAEN
ncbi:MAG: hypothetical protein ACKO7B_02965, partial [Flavobacteriales bacterium]